jgi:hypothetical protein
MRQSSDYHNLQSPRVVAAHRLWLLPPGHPQAHRLGWATGLLLQALLKAAQAAASPGFWIPAALHLSNQCLGCSVGAEGQRGVVPADCATAAAAASAPGWGPAGGLTLPHSPAAAGPAAAAAGAERRVQQGGCPTP